MTTRTGHAVGDRMADHLPHGPGAVAVPHLNGMSQGISLRKGRVMNREKSLVKEKKEGDLLAAGADPDTGKFSGTAVSVNVFVLRTKRMCKKIFHVKFIHWLKK